MRGVCLCDRGEFCASLMLGRRRPGGEEVRREEEEKEEEEEEEGLFKADAVNEEDPERDRTTQE